MCQVLPEISASEEHNADYSLLGSSDLCKWMLLNRKWAQSIFVYLNLCFKEHFKFSFHKFIFVNNLAIFSDLFPRVSNLSYWNIT